jgi:hypothetical protein
MARHATSGKSKTEVLMTPKRKGEPLKKERPGSDLVKLFTK